MKSDTVKGYLFAILATVAFSNVYIFSKAALNEVHLAQFGLYWFAIGFSLNFLYVAKNRKLGSIFRLPRHQLRILLLLGVLEILTTTAFFVSINIIPDPSVTSFLGNMYMVFLTVSGIIFLKERFSYIESIGAILALGGAFIISYTGGDSLKGLFIPGTGVVMLNALLAATASIIVKKHVVRISPEVINMNRTFWLFIYAIVMFIVFKQSLIIPVSALENIAIGAVLGPFLAILFIYHSFKHIEASQSSVVQSLKGIFVLAGAFIYFRTLPLQHELIGGFITMAGVIIMAVAKAKLGGKSR
ncbi:hypothetical protein MNBD_BACTEROID01-699 [hydrothermal vent metagenome]|uniref:EamA domain-containing protein n=1 Tax=hydrothermal vent metagenome TaxID=652676 RepID=A0A3B0U339_9ZZZZ